VRLKLSFAVISLVNGYSQLNSDTEWQQLSLQARAILLGICNEWSPRTCSSYQLNRRTMGDN